MKKFTFRLQSVLDYREQVERVRRATLSEAQRRVLEQERTLSGAQETMRGACDEMRREDRGTLDVTRARERRDYVASLRRRLDETRLDLRRAEAEFGRCREEALRARNDRKVLAALKARRLARHERALGRREQAELDDIAQRQDALRRTGS